MSAVFCCFWCCCVNDFADGLKFLRKDASSIWRRFPCRETRGGMGMVLGRQGCVVF